MQVGKGTIIMRKLFTSESITKCHPDKIADYNFPVLTVG